MSSKDLPVGLSTIVAGALFSAVLYSTDHPVAYWSFEEGQGLVARDSSSNNFRCAIVGAEWTGGVAGHALEFDGIDDYVDMAAGNSLLDVIGSLREGTISVWFRFDSAPAADDIHAILEVGDGIEGSPTHAGLLIEVGHYRDNRRLYFTYYDSGSVFLCFETVFNLELNRWYHFAVVVGEGYNTGFLDGEELVGRHYNFGLPTDRKFFDDVTVKSVCWVGRGIQACCDRGYYFHGAIDELRIYDRPLSGEEIREYYESVILAASSPSFRRGDCNDDGGINIADAQYLLNFLFLGGPKPPCEAASDINDEGAVNIADAQYLLNFLFLGGPRPDAPYPDCGPGPENQTLGCESSACE